MMNQLDALQVTVDTLVKRVEALERKGAEETPEPAAASASDEIRDLILERDGARKVAAAQRRVADERTRERDKAQREIEELKEAAREPRERCAETESRKAT